MVFQLLGWMWALSFALAVGSYTFLAISLIGHIILIGAVAITAATYTAASKRPQMFSSLRRN
jgi:polyferredoxin